MTSQTILITGGAGFIGSHITKMLDLQGYKTIVFDNFSTGSSKAVTRSIIVEGDLANSYDLDKVFGMFDIDAVMHFAASIDVRESVSNPAKYYLNNVSCSLNLLEAMRRHRVSKLVFSSSAAIFGLPQHLPIAENHPCLPINPYGQSKLIIENILQDYDRAYSLKSSSLRYFNAAGGDPEGEIKNYKKQEVNLIPLLLKNLKQSNAPFAIFGNDYSTEDGTCIRDYIHIEDLGTAHISALQKLFLENSSTSYNLGNGKGFSIKEVIRAIENVTGHKVEVVEKERRQGDPPILIADSTKAKKELNWTPLFSDLETIIAHAWDALDQEKSSLKLLLSSR